MPVLAFPVAKEGLVVLGRVGLRSKKSNLFSLTGLSAPITGFDLVVVLSSV